MWGRRAEIVAWNRKEGLPSARLQRQHRPHGRRLQRHFYNGLDALDAGEKPTRRFVATTKRSRKESLPSLRIPADGQALRFLWARGYQAISRRARARRDAGNRIGKTKYADDKRHLWEQACSYARGYSAPISSKGGLSTSSATSPANGLIVRGTLQPPQACRSLARCSTRSSRATSHTRNLSGARHEI